MRLQLAVALALTVAIDAFAVDITNDGLRDRCAMRTTVTTTQGEKVGQTLHAFCAGYLIGTHQALRNAPGADCKIADDRSAVHLLSVYDAYVKDNKVPGSDSASKTLMKAFRRAFDCRAG